MLDKDFFNIKLNEALYGKMRKTNKVSISNIRLRIFPVSIFGKSARLGKIRLSMIIP